LLPPIRILDATAGIAGPYCTKLLADAGADVVKVEAGVGNRLRRWRSGARFEFLNTSKRSIAEFDESLLDRADALLLDTSNDIASLRNRHPHLVIVTITAFGVDGPWAGRPATEFTLQALVGFDREPRAAVGSTYAAVAALAAVREIVDNPQLRHRHLFEVEHHAVAGRIRLPTMPFRVDHVAAGCAARRRASASTTRKSSPMPESAPRNWRRSALQASSANGFGTVERRLRIMYSVGVRGCGPACPPSRGRTHRSSKRSFAIRLRSDVAL
jgi:hypothetical protein